MEDADQEDGGDENRLDDEVCGGGALPNTIPFRVDDGLGVVGHTVGGSNSA